MSYDISLFQGDEEVFYSNCTYNNRAILVSALGCNIKELNGRRAGDTSALLDEAFQALIFHRKEYKDLEPTNAWGGIDDCRRVISEMRAASQTFPNLHWVIG